MQLTTIFKQRGHREPKQHRCYTATFKVPFGYVFHVLLFATFPTLAQGGENGAIRLLEESRIVVQVWVDENDGKTRFLRSITPGFHGISQLGD